MNYRDRFKQNIKPLIGDMLLSEVKSLHCQNILNQMADSDYTVSSIRLTRAIVYTLFESAVDNEIILKNPVTKSEKCIGGKAQKEKRVLAPDEHRIFLNAAVDAPYYYQYSIVLQTGIRVGELTGLKWGDVDFENRVLHIRRTMDYRMGRWETRTPKSRSGYRDIPLTAGALQILTEQKKRAKALNIISIAYPDLVFLDLRGNPIYNALYCRDISGICKRIGIKSFSMHTLRHTFATRCIEAGMKPKILQSILGHSDIGMTMNLYVHATEEEKAKEVTAAENVLKVV